MFEFPDFDTAEALAEVEDLSDFDFDDDASLVLMMTQLSQNQPITEVDREREPSQCKVTFRLMMNLIYPSWMKKRIH
ncbi:hypothetical protein P4S72_03905 [Vibrio sp. PP-XX7]